MVRESEESLVAKCEDRQETNTRQKKVRASWLTWAGILVLKLFVADVSLVTEAWQKILIF